MSIKQRSYQEATNVLQRQAGFLNITNLSLYFLSRAQKMIGLVLTSMILPQKTVKNEDENMDSLLPFEECSLMPCEEEAEYKMEEELQDSGITLSKQAIEYYSPTFHQEYTTAKGSTPTEQNMTSGAPINPQYPTSYFSSTQKENGSDIYEEIVDIINAELQNLELDIFNEYEGVELGLTDPLAVITNDRNISESENLMSSNIQTVLSSSTSLDQVSALFSRAPIQSNSGKSFVSLVQIPEHTKKTTPKRKKHTEENISISLISNSPFRDKKGSKGRKKLVRQKKRCKTSYISN
ncbi:uncharacterized protein PRCAT00003867001 [Priceomyces carsonii]|uniref:uncharacterized protein n=1 Tax=Priceomyces carsonii TaxID=28549 RepID=UPI002ED8CB2F|nr:unnamed protein product [Priceomyces carsonii]